jgi:hypothetical protein
MPLWVFLFVKGTTQMLSKCNKCEQMKPVEEFYKYCLTRCKACTKKQVKQYRKNNPDKIKAEGKANRQKNKEYHKQYGAAYYAANKEKLRQDQKALFLQNGKKYRQAQLDHRRNTPAARLSHTLRTRARNALKGRLKAASTQELLGCTFEEARAHIEAQFQPGMTWENYSPATWHIDHIKPLKSFDLFDPAQQKLAFHFTNLQPLWAQDNLSKGAKFLDTPTTS